MELTLADALVFWPALCVIGFAWERHTRSAVCGLCANVRPLVGALATTRDNLPGYIRHDYVEICADCYTLTHTMENTTHDDD